MRRSTASNDRKIFQTKKLGGFHESKIPLSKGPLDSTHIHTHMRAHTHMHAHTHTQTHTCAHIHARSHAHTNNWRPNACCMQPPHLLVFPQRPFQFSNSSALDSTSASKSTKTPTSLRWTKPEAAQAKVCLLFACMLRASAGIQNKNKSEKGWRGQELKCNS